CAQQDGHAGSIRSVGCTAPGLGAAVARSWRLRARRRRLVGPLPGAGGPAERAGAAARLQCGPAGPLRGARGGAVIEAQPLAGLGSLARAAEASRAAADALRWLADSAMGLAGQIVLSLALDGFGRNG